MFGRRITRSGWLQLGALAFAVFAVLFLIFAPITTVSITLDLPPAGATPKPVEPRDLFALAGLDAVVLAFIGVVAALVWLVIWTARRIIGAQPKIDS